MAAAASAEDVRGMTPEPERPAKRLRADSGDTITAGKRTPVQSPSALEDFDGQSLAACLRDHGKAMPELNGLNKMVWKNHIFKTSILFWWSICLNRKHYA